ncbi:MAG: hypothetical protein GX610_23110 [Rhodococcus sp.]|nr:hypothetical protein [Rhodococcus sp. (in: high G+C Gram-positive bacteria)]
MQTETASPLRKLGTAFSRARSDRNVLRVYSRLDIPQPWDMTEFVAHVEDTRRRRITLMPVDDANLPRNGTFGMWLALADEDVITYTTDTTLFHQNHIVCHELGHMLMRHRSTQADAESDAASLAPLFPDLDIRSLESILGRSQFSTAREYEAEQLATLIMRDACEGLLSRSQGVAARLGDALRGH